MRAPIVRLIRQVLCGVVYYSGLLRLWRSTANRDRPIVVSFHDVRDEDEGPAVPSYARSLITPLPLFRDILAYLARRYLVVRLEEAVECASEECVAITFDDGFRGVYEHAWPVLNEMGLPATVFVTTDFVSSSDLPWWDTLELRLKQFMELSPERRFSELATLGAKWRAVFRDEPSVGSLVEMFKESTSAEREELEGLLSSLFASPGQDNGRLFLSEQEIREMSDAGVTFGAHTKSHPILPGLSNQELLVELREPRAIIEGITGSEARWLAYPDGAFGAREERAAQEVGYDGAVQTYRRPERTGRFAVARVGLKENRIVGARGHMSRAMLEVELHALSRRRLQEVSRSWLAN